DAPLAAELVSEAQRAEFEAYLEKTKQETEIERQSTERPKTGVFLGVHATNPVNGEQVPIWSADYVLSEYGTGAIMAVPAHDQRDLDFARTYGLDVRTVIDTGEPDPATTGIATAGDGAYVNSGLLDGLSDKKSGVARMNEKLAADGQGEAAITFRLRDWLLSRQRFWGCPIPIVHCPEHGEVMVPDDQLPVLLPDLRGADLKPKGTSPLANATDWVNTTCPTCGGPATRDADTMDTFVDSSWYFFRYCSPNATDAPFDKAEVATWMPVDQYVGGVEHAILHLLYARFFTKVLNDLGMVDFDEPFQRLMNQGQVINKGKAMSKSLGNGVDLGAQIDQYGVDAIRTTVVFAGPPEDDIDWADVSPGATLKFLQRAYRVACDVVSAKGVDPSTGDLGLRRTAHKTLGALTDLLESRRFNVVVARLMELVNATRKAIDTGCGPADPAVREAAEFTAVALSLFAPYVAEEMWEVLGHAPSIANASWPVVDPALRAEERTTMVVQVQGKVRAKIEVPTDITEEDARAAALADANVQRALDSRDVAQVILRLPKMVSIVPR
ncbi:MAG: class I tRNA ligase family protein, partial [Propionibacteriaceae bacterium]